MKRMAGLLATYEDKKTDLKQEEKSERQRVIKLLKEALRIIRVDYEQQTKQFEMGNFLGGGGNMSGGWGTADDAQATLVTDTSNIGFSLNNDRRMQGNPDANILLGKRIDSSSNDSPAHQGKSAASTPMSGVGSTFGVNDFAAHCNEAQKTLESLEKKHLLVEGDLDEAV